MEERMTCRIISGKRSLNKKKTFAAGTKIEFWSAVYLSQIRPEKKETGLEGITSGGMGFHRIEQNSLRSL